MTHLKKMTTISTYNDKVSEFRSVLDKSIQISKLIANKYIGPQNYWMSVLMVRYLNIAIAINRLLPNEGEEPSNMHSWDFGAIATLTRNFIETFHAFFCLGIEEIDDDEWNLRLKVFHLHDSSRRNELFKLMGDTSQNEKFQEISEELLLEIKNNKKFLTLNKNLQKRIIKAETAFILSRQEIEKRIDPKDSSINGFICFYQTSLTVFQWLIIELRVKSVALVLKTERIKYISVYQLIGLLTF